MTTVTTISNPGAHRLRQSHGLKRRGLKSDDCHEDWQAGWGNGDWQAEDPKVTTVTRIGKPGGKPDDSHEDWQAGGPVVMTVRRVVLTSDDSYEDWQAGCPQATTTTRIGQLGPQR